jgi:hypothetical protein
MLLVLVLIVTVVWGVIVDWGGSCALGHKQVVPCLVWQCFLACPPTLPELLLLPCNSVTGQRNHWGQPSSTRLFSEPHPAVRQHNRSWWGPLHQPALQHQRIQTGHTHLLSAAPASAAGGSPCRARSCRALNLFQVTAKQWGTHPGPPHAPP